MLNPFLILALNIPLLLQAQQPRPDFRKLKLVGVVEVGEIVEDCTHVRKSGRVAETPIGFMISPDTAFKLAMDKIKFRCPSAFGNVLFADNDHYYITVGPVDTFFEPLKKDITPALLRGSAIRVHGLTGAVSPPVSPN